MDQKEAEGCSATADCYPNQVTVTKNEEQKCSLSDFSFYLHPEDEAAEYCRRENGCQFLA